MAIYRNAHPDRRFWPDLTVAGQTLELDPGETADIDGEVNDPLLEPATPKTPPPPLPLPAPAGTPEPDEET